MEIQLTKKQIEELIDEEIKAVVRSVSESDEAMSFLLDAFVRDGINDFYSSEHLCNIMRYIEKHDKEYKEECGTSSKLFWKSLPVANSLNFESLKDSDYIEGLKLFDDAIKEIENRKKAFIEDCKESLND